MPPAATPHNSPEAQRAGVLGYAAPPPSLPRRLCEWFKRLAWLVFWFFFSRPLNAVEVAVGMSVFTALVAMYFGHWLRATPEMWRVVIGLAFTPAMLVNLFAFAQLIAKRRLKAILFAALVLAPAAIISGVVQIERCPHATYLQIMGLSIPVAGDPCNNLRNPTPWWAR